MRFRAIPAPSISAKSTPPMMACRQLAPNPPRAAKSPPVAAPLIIEFHGSSLFLAYINAQSNVEKRPPQTAKLPAVIGARSLREESAPERRKFLGEFLRPLK